MFEPKTKELSIDGQTFEIRQLTLGQMNEIAEDADMAVVVAMCWHGWDELTAEHVRKWPMSIVKAIYDECIELNGLSEGN